MVWCFAFRFDRYLPKIRKLILPMWSGFVHGVFCWFQYFKGFSTFCVGCWSYLNLICLLSVTIKTLEYCGCSRQDHGRDVIIHVIECFHKLLFGIFGGRCFIEQEKLPNRCGVLVWRYRKSRL